MDFALRQMKAMGWSEGKGLGVSEDGITASIKPNTQKDTRGLGFTIEDSLQLKNQWWSEAYNAASKGLQSELKITSVGVIVKAKKRKSIVDTEESNSNSNGIYNDRFVSAGLLEGKNIENSDSETKPEEEHIDKGEKKKKKKSKKLRKEEDAVEQEKEDNDIDSTLKPTSIDFNEVFKNAKGMTCHKAARLGIQMNGKMKRIQEQENEFLKKLKR